MGHNKLLKKLNTIKEKILGVINACSMHKYYFQKEKNQVF